ncbi:GNAT family N-acetyltransferase [Thalassomonas actiniarum]|uniref:GNAT family N-acetyltransferase n=1 Tax=Thalassomonas actiniarum TaxID=485447 RepID=A0AAE9YKD6_9GAMM|nr:GNAT family N-acetyltransferase [Thalassomonas actiniarum]WDD97140.1 GNAT family N-acetyltransferase [Thalassomonas actiniarum]
MNIQLCIADYKDEQQGKDLLMLLNAYALDPMGGEEPLTEYVKENLLTALSQRSDMFTLLCYLDGKPAGLINCIESFSTFSCQPVINVHDVVVLPFYRGHGLSEKMLQEVENIAREKGCCKLTLEVLQGNAVAQKAYRKFGFSGYELDPEMGQAMFWDKKLAG